MRRIDEVNNQKMKNIKHVKVLDKKRLEVTFKNNASIVLLACSEDYGDDSGIYIEKENQ